jgi:hypothetical protein
MGENMKRYLFIFGTVSALAGSLAGQTFERRAEMRGNPGQRGKCTIEVVVDISAEVEIRGDRAILKNLAGQPAQWRRFVCDSVMPPNPPDFRFQGVDGRGRQQLVREPRQGGAAVIRIEDRQGGSEGYTFDVTWANGAPPPPPTMDRDRDRDRGHDEDAYHHDRDEWSHRENWREHFFEHVRRDVEHVQSETFPIGADQYRLAKTKQELNELQDQTASGRWDRRELDDVVDALTRVLQDNRLRRDDREMLTDDLNRLRGLRERR